MQDGKVSVHPARPTISDNPVANKRMWNPVGDNPALALVCPQRKALAIQELSLRFQRGREEDVTPRKILLFSGTGWHF
jgi:hypothetical protein